MRYNSREIGYRDSAMATIRESEEITGVYITELEAFSDDRGRFLETFRKEWFPMRNWNVVQANRSDSRAGVLRGLHYHFHQVDYWYVVRGQIRAGLADIRSDSPTYKASITVMLDGATPRGLFIPVGVAHGFVALSEATLTYVVDNYYDRSDEHGIAWNDPALAVQWGVNDPLLSARDEANPRLAEVPAEYLPTMRQASGEG